MMKFGPLLRKTRLLAGFTQEEMAEKMHISRPNISKLERDQLKLQAADMVRWFQITNASELAALVICGVDPVTLSNLLTQISHLIGGFISTLFI